MGRGACHQAGWPGPRKIPLPPPAPAQSRRLVPLGRGGLRQGAHREQADLPEHRLFHLPLVPRDGAGVVRGRRHGAVINELFINIKVDREERPDVDKIYMTYVQARTGRAAGR
jgi:hypothetical protein